MPPLKLTLGCWDYDRAKASEKYCSPRNELSYFPQALQDGRVQIEGVDLNFINLR